MTRISCEVKKCVYNAVGGCKLDSINVGTAHARMTDETKCESYTPGEKSAVNGCHCNDDACSISSINCSAENCKYNDDGVCEAKKIEICTCKSGTCGDTECSTFKAE